MNPKSQKPGPVFDERRTPSSPTLLTSEEAAEVIREASRLALQQSGGAPGVDEAELLAMGRELGVSEAHVRTALAERGRRAANARSRRMARIGWAVHAAAYVLTLGLLFVIDVLTGPRWWFYWPALGWGIGVVSHGVGIRYVSGLAPRCPSQVRVHLSAEDRPVCRVTGT